MSTRQYAGLIGLGFAAVWITSGFGWALLSVGAATISYGVGFVFERRTRLGDLQTEVQAKLQTTLSSVQPSAPRPTVAARRPRARKPLK